MRNVTVSCYQQVNSFGSIGVICVSIREIEIFCSTVYDVHMEQFLTPTNSFVDSLYISILCILDQLSVNKFGKGDMLTFSVGSVQI